MHEISIRLDRLPRVRDVGKGVVREIWCHPERVTDYHVFLLILSGSFQVVEDGVEHILHRGDVMTLKAGVRHWGLPKTTEGTSWYWVHFYPFGDESDDPRSAIDVDLRTGFYTADQYDRSIVLPKQVHLKDPADVETRIAHVRRLFSKATRLHRYWVSALFYEVVLALYETAAGPDDRSSRRQILSASIREYIDTHFDGPVDSESLSHALRMNYRYLSTVFRQTSGMTIRRYTNLVRVRQATYLLRSTRLNVSEIAHQVGFRDPLYFSRIFKRETGLSPSDYRQTLYPPSGLA